MCQIPCVGCVARYIMLTLQHMHFAIYALCNMCTLQYVHFATHPLCNTYTLQNVYFATCATLHVIMCVLQHAYSKQDKSA